MQQKWSETIDYCLHWCGRLSHWGPSMTYTSQCLCTCVVTSHSGCNCVRLQRLEARCRQRLEACPLGRGSLGSILITVTFCGLTSSIFPPKEGIFFCQQTFVCGCEGENSGMNQRVQLSLPIGSKIHWVERRECEQKIDRQMLPAISLVQK